MQTRTRQITNTQTFSPKTIWRTLKSSLVVFAALLTSHSAFAWQPGKDGAGNITTANTVINTYYTVPGNLATGATTVTLNSGAGLSAGDLLMIYQAQGATIDTSDTASYGSITALNDAGNYEFVSVVSVAGATVTISNLCGTGLRNNYTATGRIQAVRVPQYTTLSITGAGTVTSTAWNGASGGIVAAFVTGAANLGGGATPRINVVGQGFRGGALEQDTSPVGANLVATFRSTSSNDGAEKGEGLAGYQADYDTQGRYGRGAPANGGGGGNGHNAAGGGGSNGNNGVAYTGLGNPNAAAQGTSTAAQTAAAWNLEGAGFATSTSSGGGRGGYSFSGSNADALTQGPGVAAWGGDQRDNVGGRGGRPLINSVTGKLFFGGGGGAGDTNNSSGVPDGSRGRRGGGLVYLVAGGGVTGGGTIEASGETVAATSGNDAPGGGGGGGTIVVSGAVAGGATLTANGSVGGNQNLGGPEAEGPGGGGGGGFIAATGGTQNVLGAANGTTNSSALTEFIHNGATRGANGNAVAGPALSAVPVCPTATLTLEKIWSGATVNNAVTVTAANTGQTTAPSFNSVANTPSETDTGTAVAVGSGRAITISEAFTTGTASNYTSVLTCSGNGTALSGAVLTANGNENITCRFTNTLNAPTAGSPIAPANSCPADFFQTRQGVDGGGAQQTAVLRFPASVLTGGGAATNLYSPATTLLTTGVNGVGYRRQDGYIYGLNTGSGGTAQLVRIGLGGAEVIGNIQIAGADITGFTPTGGTFDEAGNYYFAGQGGGNITPPNIYRIDGASIPGGTGVVPVSQVYALSTALVNVGDIAFGPDGRLYGATGTTLAQITLSGSTATVVTTTLATAVGGIGSAFFNDAGQFFVYDNGSSSLRQVSFTFGAGFPGTTATGAAVVITPPVTPTTGQSSDGASCVTFDINVTAAKTDGPTNTTYSPGATDTYTITVTNTGTSPAFGVQVLDNLPNGVTLTGPWSCVATGIGSCSAASGGTAGGSTVSLSVNLAPGGTATITVPVTYSSNPGDY
jgi:uncharacterized repeat protein (TIGR01451 family)